MNRYSRFSVTGLKLFVFLLFAANADLPAQTITWTEITDSHALPNSVRMFRGDRSSPALKCWYISVDLADTAIAVRGYLRSSPTDVRNFAASVNAYAAVNGGFFGGSVSYSAVIHPGELKAANVPAVTRDGKSYPVIRSMFSLNKDFKPSVDWVYHYGSLPEQTFSFSEPLEYSYNDSDPLPAPSASSGTAMTDILTGVGGAPVLVKDGSVRVTYNEEILWGSGVGLDNRDPRTAVGFTADDHVIILAADGRQTASEGLSLPELAEVMISLGCVEAMNLDGGGSTQMAVPGAYINSPSETYRSVPSILAVTRRDSARVPVSDAYEFIMDTEDRWCRREGSWFETANSGYWGNTKSLLCQSGDGSGKSIYDMTLQEERTCELFAWWVASSNRCKDTPYVISHRDGTDTVRMDQSTGHAQWNYIGTYTFTSGRGQNVTVSNLATPAGYYVVSDAVKLSSGEGEIIPTGSVSVREPALPVSHVLLSAYPNPFNSACRLTVENMTDQALSLDIYDLQGRHVSNIMQGQIPAGRRIYNWNGSDSSGRRRSSGIYFAVVSGQGVRVTEKFSLIY